MALADYMTTQNEMHIINSSQEHRSVLSGNPLHENNSYSDSWALAQMVIMGVFCTVGLIGNTASICLLVGITKLEIMSRYVVGRAIADILTLVILPLDSVAFYHHSWIFGDALCKLRNATSLMSLFVSSAFQVGMCANAYVEEHVPRPSHKLRSAVFKILALFSWFFYFMFGASILLQSETMKEVQSERIHCVSWLLMQETTEGLVLRVISICFILIVPFIIIWVLVALTVSCWNSSNSYVCQQRADGCLILVKRQKQLSFFTALVFTICQGLYWLPYLVLETVEMVVEKAEFIESVMAVLPVTIILPAVNACINSVLYIVFMREAREQVMKMKKYPKDNPMIPLLSFS